MPNSFPASEHLQPSGVRHSNVILAVLFFFSGASALTFENLWQRLMTLQFGASAPATLAILTSLFAGIAIGSYFSGPWLDRTCRPLVFYCGAELAIGTFGLAVPLFLAWSHSTYVQIANYAEPNSMVGFTVRFLLAVLVTLPATLAMGATVPAMNRLLAYGYGEVGKGVSIAYGINTLGAVFGCLASALIFIPALGIQATLRLSAGINVAVAIGAVVLLRGATLRRDQVTQEGMDSRALVPQAQVPPESAAISRLLPVSYFLAGAIALGLEVTWMRLLAIYSTSSTLTFSLALAVYLLGYGVGSAGLYPLLARFHSGTSLFVISLIGSSASTILLLPAVYWFPEINERLLYDPGGETVSLGRVAFTEGCLALWMIFLPALFMGLAYPSVCRAAVPAMTATGRVTGLLYFLGTAGAAFGVLFVGGLSIPVLGFVATLTLLCSAGLVLGIIFLVRHGGGWWQSKFHIVAIIGLLIGVMIFAGTAKPFWQSTQRSPGVLPRYGGPNRMGGIARLVRYDEGSTATVMVVEMPEQEGPPSRRLLVDGKTVSSTTLSALTDAKVLAHLPLLLHPAPQRALTVGFGSGGTSWSMTRYGIDVECVEIEPEVVRSAHLFSTQNFNVLSHAKFQLVVNDARDHLQTTKLRYDVIATDVTSLEYKHNGSLYTREYFELMKARLTESGIACAWIPMGGIATDDFKTLLRTFQAVFDQATLWFINHTPTDFAVLIATPGPFAIDVNRIQRAFADPDIAADLRFIGIEHPYTLVNFLHLDPVAYHEFVGPGPVHTDDYPVLEFSSPATVYHLRALFQANLQATLPHRSNNVSGYVRNLPHGGINEFERYRDAANRRTEAITNYQLAQVSRQDDVRIAALQKASELLREALGPFRNDHLGMLLLNRVEQMRSYTGGTGRAIDSWTAISEDFEGRLELAFFPFVSRYRPPRESPEFGSWVSAMRQLSSDGGVHDVASPRPTTALRITPSELSMPVGYFCPLAVKPGTEYTLSAQLLGHAGQTAGLLVLEFSRYQFSGEQPVEAELRERLTAVHGPALGQASESWTPLSLRFRVSDAGRMIHIMCFVEQSPARVPVWFDDFSITVVD